MTTLLLAVILVSGFIYVTLSLSTRYRYKRSNGWDAYFFVAAWGTVFFLAGGLFIFLLNISGGFRWAAKVLNLTRCKHCALAPAEVQHRRIRWVLSIRMNSGGLCDRIWQRGSESVMTWVRLW